MYAEMNILIKHRHSWFHLFLELYSSSVPGPFDGRVSKSLPFLSVTSDNGKDPIFNTHEILCLDDKTKILLKSLRNTPFNM